MPQETNLNVSPYFDDFDPQKNYYKVLFKPGYPVQARELTGLQSILQNQIEQFGNHIFKEGSVVIPGNINYINPFWGVKIQKYFNGIEVDSYIDNLNGKVIVGQDSGIRAKILYILKESTEENLNTILYLQYLDSNINSDLETFGDGENLLVEEEVSPGFTANTPILQQQAFARSANTSSSVIGSAIKIESGIYFLRGNFVSVYEQILILEAESTSPSYRVGFRLDEQVINSDIDDSLVDNAKGFSNYAAPGADRFKISATLEKINYSDNFAGNFIEIIRISNGVLEKLNKNPEYNILLDELARRTYDESGDYYVSPFSIDVRNSLDDGIGNNGIYQESQVTYQQNVPSDDLGCYKISSGKAYVKGYETELISPLIVDFEKPRTTKTLENQSLVYSTGFTYTLNRVYGSPSLGFSTSYTISLRDRRLGVDKYQSSGKEIGISRVYDFALESGSYNTSNLDQNEWDISLYDIQTYTEIVLNEPISITAPTHIKGKASGASGFLRYDVNNSGIITAYNVNGNFILGEKFIFDGEENTRIATAVTSFGLSQVKSLYGLTGLGQTFSADVKQYPTVNLGLVNITAQYSGISTVTSSDFSFVGIASVGNIVSFTSSGLSTSVFARIQSVNQKSLTITGVTTVTGICDGKLPSTSINPSDFKVLTSKLQNSPDGLNEKLYAVIPKKNVSSINLDNATISIRKQFEVTITSNSLSISPTLIPSNEVFLPFDEERYVLTLDNGSIEPLTSDKFQFDTGGRGLTISGLQSNGNARLIATLSKNQVKTRIKNKNRVQSITIDRSRLRSSGTNQTGIGNTTLNDGITYGNYPYGTRVQDDEICLFVPEVTKLYSVLESSGAEDPVSPSLLLENIISSSSTTSDVIVGERLVGNSSGSDAICIGKPNSTTIEYISLDGTSFVEGETIRFKESNVIATINTINLSSNDITKNFTLDNGQKLSILDYSKIVRKEDSNPPTKKIKIIFESAYIPTSDSGDITTIKSYDQFDYCDLPSVNNTRVSDIIDIRPRVSEFSLDNSSYSPFEFFGRSFDTDQNSSKNILASDESLIVDYSFYLGRIDRIYISKDKVIQVQQGTPSENPELPYKVEDSLEIGRVTLPPYLCNLKDVSISLIDHKRYRMRDISLLENRVRNLEFYTTLSLLENQTKNLQITDSNGIDRFKSGLFVDNFTTTSSQTKVTLPKNSIDVLNTELRPSPYTTQIDLVIGSKSLIGVGNSIDQDADIKYVTDLISTNIKRSGVNPKSTGKGILSLDYTSSLFLSQPFATRIENVTPYLVTSYFGSIELNPSSDTWVDAVKLEPITVTGITGEFTYTTIQEELANIDTQSGWSPVVWNAWENNWTGSNINTSISGSTGSTTLTLSGNAIRTGTSTQTQVSLQNKSLGDRVVNVDVAPFIRSRNIEFNCKKMKPFSRIYGFFDGQQVSKYMIPKLIEITMLEGIFQVGENVQSESFKQSFTKPEISFRLSKSNHKYGPFNNPSEVFAKNPYNPQQNLASSYSASSTILNVDTVSLSENSDKNYGGYISTGMILVGKSSKARARITRVIFTTDSIGDSIGSLFIPDPNLPKNPSFKTGTRTFKLTSDSNNSPILGSLTSEAEQNYYADGILQQTQEVILSVRNTQVTSAIVQQSQAITQTSTSTFQIPQPPPPPQPPAPVPPPAPTPTPTPTPVIQPQDSPFRDPAWIAQRDARIAAINAANQPDPLAQTFFVGNDKDDGIGCYVTHLDLFFQSKSKDLPVVVELRSVTLGTPTTVVYPFSRVVLNPNEINVSNDASIATRIEFPAPVYLKGGGTQHAIVILSDSNDYNVWISRLGEVDISDDQNVVTSQNLLGSLFKSQNASTWTPSQYEDLKFNLYSAIFATQGNISFFSPTLNENNKQIARLRKDSLQINSKKIRVGINTNLSDVNLSEGNLISQYNSSATATFVGSAGSIGSLQIINAGIGYTPSSGSLTYNNVLLTSLTGSGRNATADITINNGVATASTISIGGTGYVVGDVLSAENIGVSSLGRNLQLSVVSIASTNELILDNVQGEFSIGAGSTLRYASSVSGVGITEVNGTGGNVIITSTPYEENDGLHIQINHRNHGMHSLTNTAKIYNTESDILPATLVSEYSSSSSNDITIIAGFTTTFSSFENVSVASTNPGYILIDDEIISYTGITGNVLTGITRGIDSTVSVTHSSKSKVYKYELGGVSLRRINKTHQLQDSTISNPIGLDYYTVKVDMSSNGIDRSVETGYPKLYLNSTKSTGGSDIRSAQNIPFEIIRPVVQTVVHPKTKLTANVRTTSGTSISGSETSFEDKGFSELNLSGNNYFSTPRIVASKINEDTLLTNQIGNKSMEVKFEFSTSDNRLSPILDLDRVAMILTSNRVNNIIQNYSTDNRVSTLTSDPSAFVYATKPIELEIAAKSIKVIVSAYINPSSDLRALYAIMNNPNDAMIYYPFPGYSNLLESGQVIDISNSDGTSDQYVPKNTSLGFGSNEITFKDYEFTIDNLESFRYFSIKLVGSSTNQSYPPRLRDLRVVAVS